MGFFSWKTSDTNESIPNCYSSRQTFTVYLLRPGKEPLREDNYEGYGVFGGLDVYLWAAEANAPDQLTDDPDDNRSLGISLCFGKESKSIIQKYPIKLVRNPNLKYEDVGPSKNCKYQGFFYD
jgi:hypothetical protein